MSENKEVLSDQEIGERLRIAREGARITQAAAAEAIGAARTTVVALEQGQRRVRTDELQKLAALYGTSANALLRRESIHIDMIPRFRKLTMTADEAALDAVKLLNDLVRAEVELENALGVSRYRNYPPERPVLPGNIRQQAELDAQELRAWLGLGSGPCLDIISLLELQLGIRVFLRPLHGSISGLFAFDEISGASILLNSNHPPSRLIQTALHELAHFISARHQPDVLAEGDNRQSREEIYADAFARCFLMPARPVRERFLEITAGQSHFTRRHIILLAHAFGVSREALTRRLEELELAKKGTWNWFVSNGGISDDHAREVLGDTADLAAFRNEARRTVPLRVSLLAREAWKRDIYSEGQLARLLRLDRYELRTLLDGTDNEEREANELVKISD
ncbi:MAG: XRE family transcriptional regulator [Pseudotabrizicola sp.]|jgi:transcriptional regulator, XRE family|uniref:helix-turn-helix domain-containing protein n=1 Tax=Pseudotabrizicola sp. TaxID=2939647 RepID=UPI00272FD76D|nr:XRE family transcriptional regulator [Pseudotabrizicola sp.]MDP2079859.1 XRE family transcriptional regulator [Pseudotabrizicola sp.]MDZ7575609.1 XRE family transcriptional regulator [Pseudotabrizicola sp.]